MKTIILLLALTGVCQSLLAQTASERALLDLHQRKFKWLSSKQYDSLNQVLDERLQYIHSNGWMETKQQVIDDLKSGKLNYVNIEVKEAIARVYGNTGVVTGKGLFSVQMDGKPLEISLYYTEVYVLEMKHWKLVSRHACRL